VGYRNNEATSVPSQTGGCFVVYVPMLRYIAG
jgi:hypothetical protein